MTRDLSQLTDEQLMDMRTPMIFVPRDAPVLRAEVLADNAAIEAELAARGIRREAPPETRESTPMELTRSQYGALVDAFVQAFVDVMAGSHAEDIPAIRAEAETRLEDAAAAAYEQIQEDPRESTGWNSEVWDNLVVGLQEDDYAASGIDRIARRAAEIVGVPLPTPP